MLQTLQTAQSLEARGPTEARSVEVVLRDALDKLRAAAPKKLKELRDECTADLERLDNSSDSATHADEFFKSLKLACEAAGNPKLVSISLDCIQKLLSSGYLTGKGPDPFKDGVPGAPPRTLIDTIVETVCDCAEQSDETVQLQMVRALLTAVNAQSCEVHGNALMLAVDTCVKVHRDSKSAMNQRTAQGSLGEMLRMVAQRMELSCAELSRRTASFEESEARRLATRVPPSELALLPSELALLPPSQLLNDWMASYLARLVDDVVLQQEQAGQPENGTESATSPGKFGWCVVCRSSAAHYCVDTKDPVCSHKCKFRNLERLALVEMHFGAHREEEGAQLAPLAQAQEGASLQDSLGPLPEAASMVLETMSRPESMMPATVAAEEPPAESAPETLDKSLNPHHRDAVMVFSYLCKMSTKDSPAGLADARVVRSKRMALELVLAMLQHCGPVFRSSTPFITALKRLLCVSLIRNSVSPIQKIFGLSLQIFVILITNFKEHLRNEIGVFIEQIFLRILESGNSTYLHKQRVLQVFDKLCTDATTALELFLNFDCDVDEKNIFERMIDCLSKIAQGKYTSSEHSNSIQPHQEQELKTIALEALVTLMGSIVDWSRRQAEDQKGHQLEDGHDRSEHRGDKAEPDSDDDAKSDATFATSGGVSAQTAIVEQKQRKLELQIGVNKFNMKPKRGIEYLKQNGFVTDDPQVVADFFRNREIGLDKTAIGDYLGEDKPFNKGVLYALVDGEDFKGQELDGSLRTFLSIFRLPGEAQKIDRMMEKFAEKYCSDNPDKFANADCAFVLSFSLIMLQTDLHNPGVKNKMTKDEFVRNNRGINDNNDLPREYLEKLYESVATNPISLQEDEEARNRIDSQSALGVNQKNELFVRETESIVQKSQEMMKQKVMKQTNSAYIVAQSVDHVRPLFEVACWPYLATLAVLLEMQDSARTVELCIEGFKHCIRIAARFDMETEREAFVSSLANFTLLTTVKEMKQKNIECIKALLAIGLSEGNNLGPSWFYVLHCVGQLERLQLIGIRARQDFQFFQGEEEVTPSPQRSSSSFTGTSHATTQVIKRRAHGLGVSALVSLGNEDRQVEMVNSESIVSQIDPGQIDLLFNRSTSLGSSAIVHFVTQLTRVSKDELLIVEQPRIFSLQKLVEVADFNMNRMRVVWSRIWRVLSNHFIEAASHPNIRVCMYAIDSLRQLAMKFLEKDELSNYNFQAEFLRPFEIVMVSSQGVSREVKDLIVSIISNMVQARIRNIKSGWKTVFHILHAAAQEHASEAIAQCAFAVVEKLIDKHCDLFAENFSDGIRTLLAFGHCKANLSMSLKAIQYLLQAAEYLADKTKPDPPPPSMSLLATVPSLPSPDAIGVAIGSHPAAHWFPILRGLSTLVSDPRRDVRAAALNGVFDCLRDYGGTVFDEDTWHMVYNGVVKPLFDDIHHQLQHGDAAKQDGASETGHSDGTASSAASMGLPTCLAALTALVKLIDTHFDTLSFLLDDVLRQIENCIQHDDERVARIGVEAFKQFLLLTGCNLKPESWQKVTSSILRLFRDNMPTKLMCGDTCNAPDCEQLPFRKNDVVVQCVLQLLLIDMLQDTVAKHYDHISPAGIMALLDALQQSFEFAQVFNQQIELRQNLKRLGFMREMKQLPGLLKQEREALSCSLKILFQAQNDARMQESEYAASLLQQLIGLCANVLRNYALKEQLLQERTEESASDVPGREREAVAIETEREVMGLVPIISEVVMKGLANLDEAKFAAYAEELFPLLCDLTIVNSREVRLAVRDVLLAQVAPLLGAAGAASGEGALAGVPEAPALEVSRESA